MSKKIKVLQITTSIVRGGTEAYIMNNYLNINHDNFQFDFYLFENLVDAYDKEINELGGKILIGISPRITNLYKTIRSIQKYNEEYGPYDVIHAHTNYNNAWVLLGAYFSGISNRISHSHTAGFDIPVSRAKQIYNRMKRMIINHISTSKIAASLEAGIWLYGKNQFQKDGVILRNGIDIYRFQQVKEERVEALKNEFKLADHSLVFGNITRFDHNKNQSFILDIFKEIKSIHSNSVLLLGGNDGEILEDIKEKVRQLQLEDSVRFIGVRRDVEVCLKILDGYIFPSRIEGLGMAALEAQAAGTPIFASDTIPREVDIGVDLIHFLSLKREAKFWAHYILEKIKKPIKVDDKAIEEAFHKKGYHIGHSIKTLEEIYSSSYK